MNGSRNTRIKYIILKSIKTNYLILLNHKDQVIINHFYNSKHPFCPSCL